MTDKNIKLIEGRIVRLRNDLSGVRRRSLNAARMGDYMTVARLTAQAANINREIMDSEIQQELTTYV